ncbi:E3 ubiquitin-protein ligase TOM1-like [Astathelohania contejeani]|uniref:HECT-type E3 ubiquitin transferase n=1 Tax=Astathelohania contejeani TaxID=164912 RepID=A0ABQ7HZK9_9MICR|nr:E3 ubiquitin-protein ligase TOM1-like [Thelohania contejeani]
MIIKFILIFLCIVSLIIYIASDQINKNNLALFKSENYKKLHEMIIKHFVIDIRDDETHIPVENKPFSVGEKKIIYEYFDKATELKEIMNHSFYFLIFSNDEQLKTEYITIMTELIMRLKHIDTKASDPKLLLPHEFKIDPILDEILLLKTSYDIPDIKTSLFCKYTSLFEARIERELFITWCSFYFYFSGTHSYPFKKNIYEYLLMISEKNDDLNRRILRLYEIGVTLNELYASNVHIKYIHNLYAFPAKLIVSENKYVGEVFKILSKKMNEEKTTVDENIKVMKYFFSSNKHWIEGMIEYLNFKSTRAFFENLVKGIFKINIKDTGIFKLLYNYNHKDVFFAFFVEIIIEAFSFSNNVEETKNQIFFILNRSNRYKTISNQTIFVSYARNFDIRRVNITCVDMINQVLDINISLIYYQYDNSVHLKICDICGSMIKKYLINQESKINALSRELFNKREEPDYKNLCYYLILLQIKLKAMAPLSSVVEGGNDWIATILNNFEDETMSLDDVDPILYNIKVFVEDMASRVYIKMYINRENIYRDTFKNLEEDYNKRIENQSKLLNYDIRFDGSDAYGSGVIKNWLTLLSIEFAKDTNYLLSKCDEIREVYEPQIYDEKTFYKYTKNDMRLIGRIIGVAIIKEMILSIEFSKNVYKLLLDKEITDNDLLWDTSSLKKRLNDIKDMSQVGDMNFTIYCVKVQTNQKYLLDEDELCANGNNITLDSENFDKYEKLYLERVKENLKKTVGMIRMGILDMIDEKTFDSIKYLRVLKLVISGNMEIDIEDWKENTNYTGGWSEDDDTIKWFWEFVEDCKNTKNKINDLLLALTGSYNAPIGGFENLLNYKFTITKINTDAQYQVHTCFNQIELNTFRRKEDLFYVLEELIDLTKDKVFLNDV